MGSSVQGTPNIIPMYRDIGMKNCPSVIDGSIPSPEIETPIVKEKQKNVPPQGIKTPIVIDKQMKKPPPVMKQPAIIYKPKDKHPSIIEKSKVPETKSPPVIVKPEKPTYQEKPLIQVPVAKPKLTDEHVSGEMIMVESFDSKRNSLWITPIPATGFKDYFDSIPKKMFLKTGILSYNNNIK